MADKVANPEELLAALREQLRFPERFHYRGEKAKEFVASQQGATRRTVDMLSKMIPVNSK
jgi:3-deoxy-D-manno-octulosonic-acid transferase